MTRLATCAGFADDVVAAILELGVRVELGDQVPFTELFGNVDRGFVAVLIATAVRRLDRVPLAVEEMFDAPCVEREEVTARPLSKAAITVLSGFGDPDLAGLWNDAWTALGRSDPVPGDVTQAIRGLVVQCRAAVANGWDVFVVEQRDPADA